MFIVFCSRHSIKWDNNIKSYNRVTCILILKDKRSQIHFDMNASLFPEYFFSGIVIRINVFKNKTGSLYYIPVYTYHEDYKYIINNRFLSYYTGYLLRLMVRHRVFVS